MNRALLYVLCVVLFIEIPAGIGLCQDVDNYTKKDIMSISWGSEPGKIGKIPHILSLIPGGPPSFDVDSKNTIYLLDAGNKRVLIFSDAGELITYFPLDERYYYGSSLIKYAEEEGSIYIHDFIKKIFSIYAINGEFLQRIQYSEDIGPLFTVENSMILGSLGIIPIKKETSRWNNIYLQAVLHDYEIETSFTGYDKEVRYYYNGEYVGTLYDRYIDNYIADPDIIVSKGYYVERPFVFNEQGDLFTLKLDGDGATISRYLFRRGY